MGQQLKPSWSDEDLAAGQRLRQAWDEFYAAPGEADRTPEPHPLARAEELKVGSVLARHEAELLRYPNVVGVSEGARTRQGKPTGESCLVVYVQRKIPKAALAANEILPNEIEGIPVDVVEVGRLEALPR